MENNMNSYSPAALAFLGDAVFGLMVREKLVRQSNRPANKLHKLSVGAVNAAAQCEGAKKIMPLLDENESDVFRRGRNAHTSHTPKNQTEGDYHYATGLETLFGYLYLDGKTDRLRELFDIITEDDEVSGVEKKAVVQK